MHDNDNLFFNQQPSISSLLNQLRRSTLTPRNRLESIRSDAAFVAQVAAAFPTFARDAESGRRTRKRRPLVANERCGSWYIPPADKDGSAYFKSTDGHERAWRFSTRRLNLHLVGAIEENDGIIIVDSTRRGKRMPDALSTTIPIWCTVLNLALLPNHPLSSNLFLPPYLPASTHSQISALIPSFLASLEELNLALPKSLTKPLRPLWITQESSLPGAPADSDNDDDDDDSDDDEDDGIGGQDRGAVFRDYRPVICCTASRRVVGSEVDQGGYIQGAGDDTENWAMGLTPDVFWANTAALLSASEANFPGLVARLAGEAKAQRRAAASGHGTQSALPRRQLTPYISVRPISRLDLLSSSSSSSPSSPSSATATTTTTTTSRQENCLIVLTDTPTPKDSWIQSPALMRVGLGKHKTASRNLRLALPDICSFAALFLGKGSRAHPSPGSAPDAAGSGRPPQIIVACDSGRDLSVGVALALSCHLFDDEGRFRVPDGRASFTKTLVKARLGTVMTVYPEANPSRATLQSVNSFLMDWRE
ncbi:trna a64-2 -o-ribosylphosphate transferase [Trichoderma cornu-damae]|uniref:Trna a64-2 -o-ribosylphosphate transferase n=1 Tax=Trichoderma cornu-damae TaxID=654480 RepID=A0A9P8QS51_9HYPO|nr:trna a64-2 -o-ribosylphosphate transferase [Trichoderma cornu-damae]